MGGCNVVNTQRGKDAGKVGRSCSWCVALKAGEESGASVDRGASHSAPEALETLGVG